MLKGINESHLNIFTAASPLVNSQPGGCQIYLTCIWVVESNPQIGGFFYKTFKRFLWAIPRQFTNHSPLVFFSENIYSKWSFKENGWHFFQPTNFEIRISSVLTWTSEFWTFAAACQCFFGINQHSSQALRPWPKERIEHSWAKTRVRWMKQRLGTKTDQSQNACNVQFGSKIEGYSTADVQNKNEQAHN